MQRITTERIEYNPHSVRLKGYNYTQPGAYFVTICAYARTYFFGEIKDGMMFLNNYGEIARSCWNEISLHFPDVKYNPVVVMPNHLHGIIIISKGLASPVETRHAVSRINGLQNAGESFQKPVPNSLPTIIRSFKSAVTKRLNELEENLPSHIWQRNYYEHVLRGEKDLNQAMEYINFNPSKWEMDEENPDSLKKEKLNV
jgi:REP element-mobilizing transposase RayT